MRLAGASAGDVHAGAHRPGTPSQQLTTHTKPAGQSLVAAHVWTDTSHNGGTTLFTQAKPPSAVCKQLHTVAGPPQLTATAHGVGAPTHTGAGVVQTPLTHTCPAEQHAPPHPVVPGGHTHWPPRHAFPEVQACPHAPQLATSVAKFTHCVPHAVVPAGHTHLPPRHTLPAAHALPHAPQLATSVRRSTQWVF